jgi:hypothetical protein
MTKPSVLVAAGCSWVAAKSIDTDPAATNVDYGHVEDPSYVDQHSFAGILRRRLQLDDLVFVAQHGSNNKTQARRLVDFIDQSRSKYSRIFVLWGITSLYRWEMYSSTTRQVESCLAGGYYTNQGLEAEVKDYFSRYFNEEYELQKLGQDVLLISNYLSNNNIEHLFANSFQDLDLSVNIPDQHFYRVREKNNDLLSLLCRRNNIDVSQSSVPWLNLLDQTRQFSNKSIRELQNQSMLDCATAHPTVAAHQIIADELYEYIQGTKNERI